MSQDPSGPRPPPQGSIQFAPQRPVHYPQQREVKNFVFVDEHNRPKRLKVTRACEGCRKKKIKCDAATTNVWPCSPCTRLKLPCIRPNRFDGADTYTYELEPPSHSATGNMNDGYFANLPMSLPQLPQLPQPPSVSSEPDDPTSLYLTRAPFLDSYQHTQQTQYAGPSQSSQPAHDTHQIALSPPLSLSDQPYAAHNLFSSPMAPQSQTDVETPESFAGGEMSQQELTGLLGLLNVNEAGMAPYLRNRATFRSEEPAVEDDDDLGAPQLPPQRGPGLRIRIPPELMPGDEAIMDYFSLFFAQVHPYCPVLSETLFYQQWKTARHTLSPLVLEAILAISGRLANEPAQGQQWLALASKHADSFMDTPRLSTLQALLLISKAREARPKRGYFYRSWMAIVQCVQMAKDLGLDEHFTDHEAGRPCESDPIECRMKTRIWQVIFVYETMTGAPQGRTDLAVDIHTVDFSTPTPHVGSSLDNEARVSRDFTYLAQIVCNVSRMNTVYAQIRRKKDWGIDPEFVGLNPHFDKWLADLPADLAIQIPPGGAMPYLPSPFSAHLHSYHFLSLILLHRPQLTFLEPTTDQWKKHMMVCLDSAKKICLLEEAVLAAYGLTGLQCMLRGFGFSVYAGLSCIVLHLVAMTSPDPELNTDSGEYFTRHMRIIETIMAMWPLPELHRQIDAVREAFSADTSRPFTLKATIPYNSPRSYRSSSSPASTTPSVVQSSTMAGSNPVVDTGAESREQHSWMDAHVAQHFQSVDRQPAGLGRHLPMSFKVESSPSTAHSLTMMAVPEMQAEAMPRSMAAMTGQATAWDPARILQQWNFSFSPPPMAAPQQPQDLPMANFTGSSPDMSASPQGLNGLGGAFAPAQVLPQQYAQQQQQQFMTPSMWQESVGTVYLGGSKRSWGQYTEGPATKRR